MPMAGFATGDQPVDPVETEPVQGPKKWFGRNESHCGVDLPEIVSPLYEPPVLDGDSDPDVRKPGKRRGEFGQPLVPLRKDLERVPSRLPHYVEDGLDVLQRNVLVEEVTHRVDED